MKRISIVTPCLNAEHSIRETVVSVLNQTAILSGRAELEYIVCDGGSKDRTLEILSEYECSYMLVSSQPDEGMYEALARGLAKVSGDIVAYINAGDYYDSHAFDIVLDLFEKSDVQWLTGYNVHYSISSYTVHALLPFRYRQNFFRCGMYGNFLIFVQQESTFWSSELNSCINFKILSKFKYAGDYYLWRSFAEKCDLKIVEALLGGFRVHSGQLSENIAEYRVEMRSITTRPHWYHYIIAIFDRILWYAPAELKKKFNSHGLFRYNHSNGKWD